METNLRISVKKVESLMFSRFTVNINCLLLFLIFLAHFIYLVLGQTLLRKEHWQ